MNYASINAVDIANGPGVRVSFFVSGCNHHCPGCFNEAVWDFNYGIPFDDDTYSQIIRELSMPYIDGFSILGGEPLDEKNIHEISNLALAVKETIPSKTIWLYTGFKFEDILQWEKDWQNNRQKAVSAWGILRCVDVIVDGPFIESQKDLSLKFRGSRNQRIIDVKKSLESRSVVLWEND